MKTVKNVFVRAILTVWYTIKMMWFKMNVFYWVYIRHYTVPEYVMRYGDFYNKMFCRRYVKTPSRLIMIDFDIKGDDGKKSLKANILAASKWPPTYCEVSKSGSGIHLYYWYDNVTIDKLQKLIPVHQMRNIHGEKTRAYKLAKNSVYGTSFMKKKLSNERREDLQNYIAEHYKPE